MTASRLVTSSSRGSSAVGYLSASSLSGSSLRAVATTLSPRPRAAAAHSRPKPREVPVMNQTFVDIAELFGHSLRPQVADAAIRSGSEALPDVLRSSAPVDSNH